MRVISKTHTILADLLVVRTLIDVSARLSNAQDSTIEAISLFLSVEHFNSDTRGKIGAGNVPLEPATTKGKAKQVPQSKQKTLVLWGHEWVVE